MTARTIKARATEHRNPSSAKGIYYHIHSCPDYITRLNQFEQDNLKPTDGKRAKKKLKDQFFMQHFRVLQKVLDLTTTVEELSHSLYEFYDQT